MRRRVLAAVSEGAMVMGVLAGFGYAAGCDVRTGDAVVGRRVVMGIYAPMATGLPRGVTEANVASPEPATMLCACGCGEDVAPGVYEHYRDGHGQLFAHRECVDRYYEIEYVG